MGSSTEWPDLTYHQDGGGEGIILFLGGEGGGSQRSPYQAVTGKIYRL